MKDSAGSTITYYGLAREKVLKKYPRLISVLITLVLISMSGLALFLVSDLVSFASNPDHKGIFSGVGLKGTGDDIASLNEEGNDKIGSGIENKTGVLAGINSSDDINILNRPSNETKFANGTSANGSLSSSKTDGDATKTGGSSISYLSGGSSSSSSKKRHSSSQSSSTVTPKSSSLTASTNASALGSANDKNGTVQQTQKNATDESVAVAKAVTAAPDATLAIVSSVDLEGSIGTSKNAPSKEPATIIQFDGKSTAKENGNPVSSSMDEAKTSKPKASLKESDPSQSNAGLTASNAKQKAQEMKAKLIENRNKILGNNDASKPDESAKESDPSQNNAGLTASNAKQMAQDMKAKQAEMKKKAAELRANGK